MRESRIRHLVGAGVLTAALAGCSSSGPSPAVPGATATGTGRSTPLADPAQVYLDAVNALCDALLPKVVTVTRGGSIDVPARTYLETWPAHQRLLVGFDAHVARIPVPAEARSDAATLASYVRFADRLDAARLSAAHRSQTAYAKEVRAEAGAENDPAIAALTNAGFNDSCTSR